MLYFYVAIGSAFGGMLRYWMGSVVPRFTGLDFPWATLLINVSGSLLIGVLTARLGPQSPSRALLMTGVCGGFTTFSTFSLETFLLLQAGALGRAIAYVCLSAVSCVAAAATGYTLAK